MGGNVLSGRWSPQAGAVLLAALAFAWGVWTAVSVARGGIGYAGELWVPVALALGPLGFGVAALLRLRVLAAAFYVVYVAASLVFGFGAGGPHLSVGLPLVTIALFMLFLVKPSTSPRAAAE